MIILFDLDGTLIDSTPAILESFDEAFQSFNNKTPSDDEIKSLIGLPLDIMFENLGVDAKYVTKYVDAYKKHYRPISKQKTSLLPNAQKAIKEASKIATLGIVTTKTSQYSKELMEHFGVMKYFEVLIGRDDVQNPKPHPEPILKALKQLNKSSDKIYMIGDTCLDSISAKNANINSIGVLSGYGKEADLIKCSDIVLKDSLEAISHIKNTI